MKIHFLTLIPSNRTQNFFYFIGKQPVTSDANTHSTNVEQSMTDIMNTATAAAEGFLTTAGSDTSLMYATSNDLSTLHVVSSAAVTETSILDSTGGNTEQSVNIDANSELFSTTISLITLKDEKSTTSNSEITTDSSSIYTNMTDSLNLYGNATTTTNANGE